MKVAITCEWCGEQVEKDARPDKPPPRFCNRSHSAKWRNAQPQYSTSQYWTPERRAAQADRLRAVRALPETQEKLTAHLHGETNPFRDPEVQAKARLAAAAVGYSHLTGGNGQGCTTPQMLLLLRLGWPSMYRWVPEYPVPTDLGPPYPSCYKVDIASPEYKIAIEVDGNSHDTTARRAQDSKKDNLLRALGWTVLRFSNRRVLNDIEDVMAEIVPVVIRAVQSSTSRPEPEIM